MSSTTAKKPLYKDLTFQVIAAMFLGIAFGFLDPSWPPVSRSLAISSSS